MARGRRNGFIFPPMAVCAVGIFVATIYLLSAAPAAAKYASIVVDAETGEVRHAVNQDTRNYPASLTKLMTLYLLFEAIDKGQLELETKLAVSRRASHQPASRLGLKPGQSISVRDAIQALVIKSANDVATVVAEALGGTERKFALLMTAKARKIGMDRTTFRNASGLPHRGQLSTAEDMATLARQITARFGHYYHYFAQESFVFEGRTYRTHNHLVKRYDGADGLKTGYIRASGFNVITTVERDGRRLIGVVFGGNSASARDRHMVSLLDRAFAQIDRQEIIASGVRPARKPDYESEPDTSPQATQVASLSNLAVGSKDIWGVQVGAFYTQGPALDAARKAARQLGPIAKDAQVALMPLQKSRNRILYRARILGLSKRDAYQACRSLKRRSTPCMELRLPADENVAAMGSAS